MFSRSLGGFVTYTPLQAWQLDGCTSNPPLIEKNPCEPWSRLGMGATGASSSSLVQSHELKKSKQWQKPWQNSHVILSITKKNVVHLKHHIIFEYLWYISKSLSLTYHSPRLNSHYLIYVSSVSHPYFSLNPNSQEARRGGANQRDAPRLDPLYDDPIECDSLVAKRQPVQMTNVWSKTSNRETGQNEMNHQAKIACRFERFT